MPAKQIAHGTIEIHAPAKGYAPAAPTQPVANMAAGIHPVNTGAAPGPVVQHKTGEQIAVEAAQLVADIANEAK
jgi:hypothetical protein